MCRGIVLGCLFFLTAIGLSFAQERLTITTYHPSPAGEYDNLQANKLAVGDVDGSGVMDSGDLPNRNGDLRLTPHAGDPTTAWPAGEPGQVAYSSAFGKLYQYSGIKWSRAGAVGGCYVSYTGVCLFGFSNYGSLGPWGRCQTDGNADNNFFIPVDDAPTNSRCSRVGYGFLQIGTSAVCCKN